MNSKKVELASKICSDIVLLSPSFFHVITVTFLGCLIASNAQLLPQLLFFAIVSKCFALTLEKHLRRAWGILFLLLSLAIMVYFPTLFHVILGFLLLITYLTYFKIINAGNKSPLDVLNHGLRYVLLYILAHGLEGLDSLLSLLGMVVVFTSGIAGELLVGVDSKHGYSKSTAVIIGAGKAKVLAILLLFVSFTLGSIVLNALYEFPLSAGTFTIPAYLVLSLTLWLVFSISIMRNHRRPFSDVRRKEFLIFASILVLILILNHLGETIYSTNDDCGVVEVNVRTVISGKRSWDVPWIVFDYVDENNFYYIVLHKNGILELSRMVHGSRELFLSSYQTSLNPFDYHTYVLKFNKANITIYVDNVEYFNISRNSNSVFVVKVSRSIQGDPFWLAWINIAYLPSEK